jgi:hypothetical protein
MVLSSRDEGGREPGGTSLSEDIVKVRWLEVKDMILTAG